MNIYIEADSIATDKMSGIGHATLEIIRAFNKISASEPSLHVTIIVPRGEKQRVEQYGFDNITVKTLPLNQKYINYALTRTGLPIPMDLWFGRGVYIFPNYKTWFVPFSMSLTFVHDVAFKIFPDTINPKNLLYLEANFKRWMKRTTKILSITKSSAKDFKIYYPEFANKVSVVPLGVDETVFKHRKTEEIVAVRHKYGLPSDYFLYVGNIEPRKNIATLLEAYELYYATVVQPAALVLIGGDGWQNDTILEKIKTLQASGHQIIHPKTYVPDEYLPALYSGACVLVHLAIHEGFGLPPLQAEACGTPVIASDIAALREILDPATTTFVALDNPKKVARELSTHDRHQPRGAAFDHYKNRYSWKETAAKLRNIAIMK